MKKILRIVLSAVFSTSLFIVSAQSHAGMVTTPSLLAQDITADELAPSISRQTSAVANRLPHRFAGIS